MIDNTTKTVSQSYHQGPRKFGHHKNHDHLNGYHHANHPFKIRVIAKQLFDLGIFLCKNQWWILITEIEKQHFKNFLPRISFRLVAWGSSVVDHSKSVLDTWAPIVFWKLNINSAQSVLMKFILLRCNRNTLLGWNLENRIVRSSV